MLTILRVRLVDQTTYQLMARKTVALMGTLLFGCHGQFLLTSTTKSISTTTSPVRIFSVVTVADFSFSVRF